MFIIEISTSFSVKVFGIGVWGIGMSLTVEGPTPWHIHGSASISLLFFSIEVPVDITFGEARNTSLPPVAVMPIIYGELGKRSNWKAQLPSGSHLLVSLRALDPAEAALVMHPVGTLQVSQRTIPLDLTLEKVGAQKPSDTNRLTLTVASKGMTKTRELQEPFAPAQFKEADDAEKLSEPAFSPQDSGIELAADGQLDASATALTRVVRYELTLIDNTLEPPAGASSPIPVRCSSTGWPARALPTAHSPSTARARLIPMRGRWLCRARPTRSPARPTTRCCTPKRARSPAAWRRSSISTAPSPPNPRSPAACTCSPSSR